MGNVLADCQAGCQRYGVEHCQLCSEIQRQVDLVNADGPVVQRRHEANDDRLRSADLEHNPQDMSEAEMLQHALDLSRREALVDRARRGGPPASRSPEGSRRRRRESDRDPPTEGQADGPDEGARAIEAAARAQERREQELVEQALHRRMMDEENKQRMALLNEQEDEYQESLRIDREKEEARALKQKEEEERARVEAEEAEARRKKQEEEEAEAARAAEDRRQKAGQTVEEARAKLLEEPAAGEPGRVLLQIRTPGGARLKRAFRATDAVDQVYCYACVEGGEELASQDFKLISPLPRSVFEDRTATLEEAGLKNGTSLLVEIVEED